MKLKVPNRTAPVEVKPVGPALPPSAVLRCGCEKSARFIPLYRFADTLCFIDTRHPATIKCAECGQWYVWTGTEWARTSQLDDLDRIPVA